MTTVEHTLLCLILLGLAFAVFCLAAGPVIARIWFGRVPGGRK